MLRQETTDEAEATTVAYQPVPRRDVMTDAHIEDFLDHHCAPLIGTISYEERQQLRDDTRQEILSLVGAHMELGSSREQAIAQALGSLSAPPTNVAVQRTTTRGTVANSGALAASLKPAI
jgi:hypothetical protein